MKIILIAMSLSLVSCASAPLSSEEKAVRILTRSDADSKCKELGRVMSAYLSVTPESRDNDVKRATHTLGGDTVKTEPVNADNTVHGIAYKCNG